MLWNITNIVRFEYWVEADNASEAIKDSFDRDADETTESWHAVEIDTEDDLLDEDEEDFEDEDEQDEDQVAA